MAKQGNPSAAAHHARANVALGALRVGTNIRQRRDAEARASGALRMMGRGLMRLQNELPAPPAWFFETSEERRASEAFWAALPAVVSALEKALELIPVPPAATAWGDAPTPARMEARAVEICAALGVTKPAPTMDLLASAGGIRMAAHDREERRRNVSQKVYRRRKRAARRP